MSDRDAAELIRRMASQGKAGQMTVAAPLNDAQLLALVAGILHAALPSSEVEPSVRMAAELIAKSVAGVRTGFLQRAIDAAMQDEQAAIAAAGDVTTQPNGEPVV